MNVPSTAPCEQMRRLQFSMRRFIALVALTALVLACAVLVVRERNYRALSLSHLQVMVNLKMGPTRYQYHEMQHERSCAAARWPWILVLPDPPPPPFRD